MKLDLSCQPLDVVKEFLLSSFRRGCLESPQAIAFFNIYPAAGKLEAFLGQQNSSSFVMVLGTYYSAEVPLFVDCHWLSSLSGGYFY